MMKDQVPTLTEADTMKNPYTCGKRTLGQDRFAAYYHLQGLVAPSEWLTLEAIAGALGKELSPILDRSASFDSTSSRSIVFSSS